MLNKNKNEDSSVIEDLLGVLIHIDPFKPHKNLGGEHSYLVVEI